MKYGTVSPLEKPISRLVIGSMVCTTDNMEATGALLDGYLAAGGNCIDTARVYGEKSERSVGQWMKERGVREKIVLIGKGAHPEAGVVRVNPEAINADIEQSLERFQTDFMDMYLLHRDDPSVPVGPLVEALNAQKQQGRIRAFGGSNWTTDRIQAANDYAAAHGLQGFSASSPYFGLAKANEPMWGGCIMLDAKDWEWHKRTQFPLFPWSAQASGFFTGRYTPEDRSNENVARVYYNEGNWERLRRARELAEIKGCTANNVALAYVLHQPFPVFALFGPRSVEELNSSLPAIDISLTANETKWLNLESDTR